MIAHSDPLQDQFAVLFADLHEREIGGATPDVTDQQDVVQLHQSAPPVPDLSDPGIDGRLRLFEQQQVIRQTRSQCGFPGQFASRCVERCRHGQDHVLVGQRRIGKGMLPGRGQVLQVALGGRERRDPRNLGGRIPGQDLAATVDPAMTQPALGTTYCAVGNLG